jgi:hypothetical protein
LFMPMQAEDVRVVSCVPVDALQPDSSSGADSEAAAAATAAAAAAAGDPAEASDSQQAGKPNAAAGGSAAGAAAGLQKRRKRPSGANRSPEYVEDASEGDELLLLRPQNPDDIDDDYDDGEQVGGWLRGCILWAVCLACGVAGSWACRSMQFVV